MRVTLIHDTEHRGRHAISVRLSFHQYNKSENNKGDHEATLTLSLLGDSNNILVVVFGGNNIVRDSCRDQGDQLFGPTDIQDDIWDLISGARLTYSSHWDYEGAC